MDVFDKFFRKFAYKFDKGYPDINNEQDILLLESLIQKLGVPFSFSILTEELLIFEATDSEIKRNTKAAIEKLISQADSTLGFKTQSDVMRLGNPNKVDPDSIKKLFTDILGAEEIKVWGPRSGPNPSGKFDMYEFESELGPVRIVVSGGGNAGEKYEAEFVEQAQQLAGTPNDQLPKKLKTLYDALGIDGSKLEPGNIKSFRTGDTKRSLSLAGPENVGKIISDMDIKFGGKDHYISLKNKAGSGIYSGANVPFVYEKDGKVVYDPDKKGNSPAIDTLFDIFNIEETKLVDGINAFITQEGKPGEWEPIKIEEDKFKKLLASSLGYGYYYVKEYGDDDVKVTPLLTAEDAMNAVGKITNTEIKYPGTNTKQLTMKIETDSPTFGPSQYQVAVRNTAGKILPLSLRISKVK